MSSSEEEETPVSPEKEAVVVTKAVPENSEEKGEETLEERNRVEQVRETPPAVRRSTMSSMASIPTMNWAGEDTAEDLRLYKDKIQLYFLDEDITDPEKQARKILRSIGDVGLKKLYGSPLTETDKKDPKKILQFLEDQLPKTTVNFRVHRLQLMNFKMNSTESIDSFVTRVRAHGSKCDFSEEELQERVIELVIASTPSEDFRKELLAQQKGFKIPALLDLGRKHEALAQSKTQLEQLIIPTSNSVDAITRAQKQRQRPCTYCGTHHKRRECPAYNSVCDKCGKKGHWKTVCRNDKTKKEAHRHPRSKKRGESKHRRQRSGSRDKRHVETIEQEDTERMLDTIHV
jgi:hypothetical protein